MNTLFAILLNSDYLQEDIEILKEYINANNIDQVIFFLKRRNGKSKTLLTKAFEKLVNEDLTFEEFDESSIEETIQLYVEDLDCSDYLIVYDGLIPIEDMFYEEEPITIEELC